MIDGKKVRLAAFEPDHCIYLQNWISNPIYRHYFRNIPEQLTIAQLQQFPQVMNMNVLMIGLPETNEVIGMCTYDNIRLIARSCQMGMITDLTYQGKGYTKDAFMTFVNYLFSRLGFHKVIANIAEDDKITHSKVEWGGFRKEATLRDEYFLDGRFHNDIRYVAFAKSFSRRYNKYYEGELLWAEEEKAEAPEVSQDKKNLDDSYRPSSIALQ